MKTSERKLEIKVNLSNQQVSRVNKETKSRNHGHSKIWINKKRDVQIIHSLAEEKLFHKSPYFNSSSNQNGKDQYEIIMKFKKQDILNFLNIEKLNIEFDISSSDINSKERLETINKLIDSFISDYKVYGEEEWISRKSFIEPIRQEKLQFNFDVHTKYIYKSASAYCGYILIVYNYESNEFYYKPKIDYELLKKSKFYKTIVHSKKNRPGQKKFREEISKKCKNKCIISNLSIDSGIVEAAHIKPYCLFEEQDKESANSIDNGILLSCNYHKLYDKGLISFDLNGKLLVSRFLQDSDKKILDKTMVNTLFKFKEKEKEFIRYHRENIFREIII